MPVTQADTANAPALAGDVLATLSEKLDGFVDHVGILTEPNFVQSDNAKPSVHMGPPLETSNGTQWSLVGTVPVTEAEWNQMDFFIQEAFSELKATQSLKQYTAYPHCTKPRAGGASHRRFSCAGFVIEAFKAADINLLRTGPEDLPCVGLEVILCAYPNASRRPLREAMGLAGDGPWPIVLPGYVINALDRSETEIRSVCHSVRSGDECFPSRCLTG